MRKSQDQGGFTLIEMMAVVIIFSLLAALVAPRVGSMTGRDLSLQAEELADQFELARQRAVVTGIPHRVSLDLEQGTYGVEWARGAAEPAPDPEPQVFGAAQPPLDLSPPPVPQLRFGPIPGKLGETHQLGDDIEFTAIDTPEGVVDNGHFDLRFEIDGTATGATIHLDNQLGRTVALEVLPLADRVRVRFED